MAPAAVIYLVTNKVTGQQYVGLTRFTAAKRWAEHVQKSKRGDTGSWFHRAIAKYGRGAFDVTDFMSCLSISDASACERLAIQQLEPAYNRTNGGEFTVGRRVAPEVVKRISEANTGKKRTAETKALFSAIQRARHADPVVRQATANHLIAARSLVDKEKRLEAVRRAQALRVWTDESRAKLSASCKGRRHSPDAIERIRKKKKKAVECITLHAVFDSVSEAAEALGIDLSGISRACLGKAKTAAGLQFRFIERTVV